MLKVDKVNAFYHPLQVLWDVSMHIDQGEIIALVGANGAGKSTMINLISGLLPLGSGNIEFLNKKIDGIAPNLIAELGIARVPEGGRLFPEMSVLENLEMGAYNKNAWKNKKSSFELVYTTFPRLKEKRKQLAITLSGGEKQMLAIGRSMMSAPKLIMFDELSYGLAPILMLEVFKVIKSLRNHGITILLVEQNVRQALELADRSYVLENGRIVLEGQSGELLQNELVKKAYLGI